MNKGGLPLQVKLTDVFEGLIVEEIASKIQMNRDDTMAILFELGGDFSLDTFLREVQFYAWKIAADLGHDNLEFMDKRSKAAREGSLTLAFQRSVKLWFRDGGKGEVRSGWWW